MSFRINDKLEVKINPIPYKSEIKFNGEPLPYVSKLEIIADCNDKEEKELFSKLVITIACTKIENMEEEQE